MFMYWKKRGAYELETLPPSLTQGGIERYSWSSSLDVIHDLRDDKPVQEEDWVVCQHPECHERRRASKKKTPTECLVPLTTCGLFWFVAYLPVELGISRG
ncbi:hypothetical protein JOQ06_006713 [Pogonophryne albipinna]|uniref:Uncharacterized protein n=1 Tax=Pogonophryne albipinna TaxID=1090488 RepID=A0AAD6B080_9TELE|nr:hypothetical protein JOQ06_006713 [Pogonophryne albipinna]